MIYNPIDSNYKRLLKHVLEDGVARDDRTGTGTLSSFAKVVYLPSVARAFPILSTKRVHWKSVAHELLWFLRGEDNTHYLNENGVTIWDEWAGEHGDLGPIYGVQWRDAKGVDQIKNLVKGLKEDPTSRRHLVSAWQVADLNKMALPPCHYAFQCYVRQGEKGPILDMLVQMRSCDIFLGLPFNMASYGLLIHLLAHQTGMYPGRLTFMLGDAHLYQNHIEQAKELLSRDSKETTKLVLSREDIPSDMSEYTFDDFYLEDYKSHPVIPAPIAV